MKKEKLTQPELPMFEDDVKPESPEEIEELVEEVPPYPDELVEIEEEDEDGYLTTYGDPIEETNS